MPGKDAGSKGVEHKKSGELKNCTKKGDLRSSSEKESFSEEKSPKKTEALSANLSGEKKKERGPGERERNRNARCEFDSRPPQA